MPPGAQPVFPGFQGYSNAVPSVPVTGVPGVPVAATQEQIGPPKGTPGTASSGDSPASGAPGRTASAPAVPTQVVPGEPMISYIGSPPPYLHQHIDGNGVNDVPTPKHRDLFWFSPDAVFAWVKQGKLPAPLLTIGNAADNDPGALGQPGTSVLFGDKLSFNTLYGLRINTGLFLDDSGCYSIEADGFYLVPSHIRFSVSSSAAGSPIIARPIFDVIAGRERAYITSQPAAFGTVAGASSINAETNLFGGEVNSRYHFDCGSCIRGSFLVGFRYLQLRENLSIEDTLIPLAPNTLTFLGNAVPAGDTVTDLDSFRTSNNFYGLQIGGSLTWEKDWFFMTAQGKVAFGPTVQQAVINGQSTLFDPMGNQTAPGGVLALPTNIGNFRRTFFGIVPEVGINLGVNVTPCLQVTAGYSFLAINSVLRPGRQIDHSINPTLVPTDINFGAALPGVQNPRFNFNGEMFWVHMFNVGATLHF
jgi:hypothetical protein